MPLDAGTLQIETVEQIRQQRAEIQAQQQMAMQTEMVNQAATLAKAKTDSESALTELMNAQVPIARGGLIN